MGIKNILNSEKGLTLIEVLVTLVIVGIVTTALTAALWTSSKTLYNAKDDETARDLAQAQMEYIQAQDFGASYSLVSSIPSGYSLQPVQVTAIDTAEQQVTITVQDAAGSKTLFVLSGYKVDY